jgi:hypothetical protein
MNANIADASSGCVVGTLGTLATLHTNGKKIITRQKV